MFMGNPVESGKGLAHPDALQAPADRPFPAPLSLQAIEATGAPPPAGRELQVFECRNAGDRYSVQDGVAAGRDPTGRFLGRQLMDMDEMSLGRGALTFEGVAVLERVERMARAVPIDDGEADGPNGLGPVIEKHQCHRYVWRKTRAGQSSAGLVMILSRKRRKARRSCEHRAWLEKVQWKIGGVPPEASAATEYRTFDEDLIDVDFEKPQNPAVNSDAFVDPVVIRLACPPNRWEGA